MRNKYFILAFTFLCLMIGQSSIGQINGGDKYSDATTFWKEINDANNDDDPDNDLEVFEWKDPALVGTEVIDGTTGIKGPYISTTSVKPKNSSNSSTGNTSTGSTSSGGFVSWGGGYTSNPVDYPDDNDKSDSIDDQGKAVFVNPNFGTNYVRPDNNTNNISADLYFNFDLMGDNLSWNNPLTTLRDWYLDNDRDYYDAETKKDSVSPGNGWVQGLSLGRDCDDNVWSRDNRNCENQKIWYLDDEGDGWHGLMVQREKSPGIRWSETTKGIDCNDAKYSVDNDCSAIDPCADIQKVLNYNTRYDDNLKRNVGWLKQVVSSTATPNIKEYGYEVRKGMNYDGTYKYDFEGIKKGDEYSVLLSTGSSYIGTFHSHPDTGVPIFSFQDLRHLLNLYDGAKTPFKNDVLTGVVAKDAQGNVNVYVLKVDDIAKLRTKVNDTWDHPAYAKYTTEKQRIKAIHDDQAKTFEKSNGQIEKSFLEQFPTAGISLYKANSTISSFSKLTLNGGAVTPTPCN